MSKYIKQTKKIESSQIRSFFLRWIVNIEEETFIRDVLEPMLADDEEVVRRNMAVVLERAGEMYSKRYVSR